MKIPALTQPSICLGNWRCHSKITVTQLQPWKLLIPSDVVPRLACCSASALSVQLSDRACRGRWPSSSLGFLLSHSGTSELEAGGMRRKRVTDPEPDKGQPSALPILSLAPDSSPVFLFSLQRKRGEGCRSQRFV